MHILRPDPVSRSHLELCAGSDGIVRVNLDGACILRVQMSPGTKLAFAGPNFDIAESWLWLRHAWKQEIPVD